MNAICELSDQELLTRLPLLVGSERQATAELIEHLVEVERRRLYLNYCSSLYRYCIDKLGYAEDAALKRHRVAKLAMRVPEVLDELRAGTMHLTGLFLLAKHLTAENAKMLLGQARGKSRRELEVLIAHWFPRPDVASSVSCSGTGTGAGLEPSASLTCSGAGEHGRLEPLSPSRVRVEFTANAELYDKLEKARQLLSHAVPTGDLGELFERALEALIEKESRRRCGSTKPRKARETKPGSRHVPVRVGRAVWERDGAQCTFVGADGRRCGERRFLTIEHDLPFAFDGRPILEHLCLLCSAHNQARAREVFGARYIDKKMNERRAGIGNDAAAKVLAALCRQGFRQPVALAAIGRVLADESSLGVEQLLRKSLRLLVPAPG